MLKNIPKIVSPQLIKILCEMGHGDEIVIADGNFPAETYGQRVVRADGAGFHLRLFRRPSAGRRRCRRRRERQSEETGVHSGSHEAEARVRLRDGGVRLAQIRPDRLRETA